MSQKGQLGAMSVMSRYSPGMVHLVADDCSYHYEKQQDRKAAGWTSWVHHAADILDAGKAVRGSDQHSCEEATAAEEVIFRVAGEILLVEGEIVVDANHMSEEEGMRVTAVGNRPGLHDQGELAEKNDSM